MRTVGYVIAAIVGMALLIALAFALKLGGLQWQKFFAPRHEAVRRQVFKQTRSYNESKTQDLVRFRLQYMQSDAAGQAALKPTIRLMFADYDASLLPTELASFLREVRGF